MHQVSVHLYGDVFNHSLSVAGIKTCSYFEPLFYIYLDSFVLINVCEQTEICSYNHVFVHLITILFCVRLLESQKIAQTGMVLVDVGVLSGFTLAPQAVATGDLVRKVEASPGKVNLYLDSVS